MTYNEIITIIQDFITRNCANISRYNSIPACFRPGYKVTKEYNDYPEGKNWKKKYNVVILTPIQQISSTRVKNDINYYVTSILNIKETNKTISTQIEKILFFNDMINFCCNTMCYVVSKYGNQSKPLIYKSNFSLQNINIGKDYASYIFPKNEIIKNQDVNAILLTVFNNIRNSLKTQAIKYNYINGGQ